MYVCNLLCYRFILMKRFLGEPLAMQSWHRMDPNVVSKHFFLKQRTISRRHGCKFSQCMEFKMMVCGEHALWYRYKYFLQIFINSLTLFKPRPQEVSSIRTTGGARNTFQLYIRTLKVL